MEHEDEFVAMIRELCQGAGMTPYRLVELMRVYGFDDAADPEEFYRRIEVASSLVGDPRHREAIRNALGFEHGQDPDDATEASLTDRRTAFLADKDLSLRTLIRHEHEGAVALAAQMDNVDQYFSKDKEIATRLDDLEMLVAILLGVVGEMTEESGELEQVLNSAGPLNAERLDRSIDGIDRRWKLLMAKAGGKDRSEAGE